MIDDSLNSDSPADVIGHVSHIRADSNDVCISVGLLVHMKNRAPARRINIKLARGSVDTAASAPCARARPCPRPGLSDAAVVKYRDRRAAGARCAPVRPSARRTTAFVVPARLQT
ncbi:hypothetical protein EVAR_50914_1 [Eumeta japonica]|uniref:Uncharacterized protein n=1 Tax=Eumeta variegata TaxID=151549 RepID=A0A4C1Y400_EUMVA|nr:hypothetical protein EVAR_50914_1 [Eumeta japonica]